MSGHSLWEMEGIKDENNPLAPYYVTEPRKLTLYPEKEIRMEGRLAGGCVDCLTTLLGTRLDQVEAFNEKYKEDGIIWFLECCDLNVWGIRRAMWQMKRGRMVPVCKRISHWKALLHRPGNDGLGRTSAQ